MSVYTNLTQVAVNSEEIRKLWIEIAELRDEVHENKCLPPPRLPETKEESAVEEHTLAKSCCVCLYGDDSYASKAILCHRYPAPALVPEARWCGEYKTAQDSE